MAFRTVLEALYCHAKATHLKVGTLWYELSHIHEKRPFS